MESNNNKFADLIQNCESQPLYFLTEKDGELIMLLNELHGNRPVKEDRIRDLVKSIKDGVYIPPILVAVPSRQVIEGNHRLAAMRKCLAEKVPFKIGMITCKDVDALQTARVINNTQVRWTANNRLHSYCVEGKRAYLQLRNFMEANSEYFKNGNNYRITPALALFSTSYTFETLRNTFYKGTLPLKKESFDVAELIFNELRLIQSVVPQIQLFSDAPITAWIKARSILNLSIEEFLRRLKKKSKSVEQPKDSRAAWFDFFTHTALGI